MITTEAELRAKLEEELPDGLYHVGVKPLILTTGKGGYIEYQVAVWKEMQNIPIGKGVRDQIVERVEYRKLSYEELTKAIGKLFIRDEE